jgi:uncharacterized membrane protein HdeD (DUF308 family)
MSANDTANPEALRPEITESVYRYWMFYLFEGAVLLLLGLVAIVVPPAATLGITIVIGCVFLASGAVGLFTTFWIRRAPGFWWSLISALSGIGAGLVLLTWTGQGIASLMPVLIAFFVIEAATSIMFGLEQRQHISKWSWMVASGLVDLLIAAALFAGLPGNGRWALGMLVGINMIFGGAALVVIAFNASTARVFSGKKYLEQSHMMGKARR